jgi:hypothetical protein
MAEYEEELYTADARCGIEDIQGLTSGLLKDG